MASFTTTGGLQVTGAWTRAGLGSCIRVQGPNKQEDMLFDCGVCEAETIAAGFVFISHGHVDHIGASISHARNKVMTSKSAVYYVPTDNVAALEEARAAFSKLDGRDIPMNIVPCQPGDCIEVNDKLIVRVFPTVHRVPSQGYAVYRRTRSKQKLPEYSEVKGEALGELKKQGIEPFQQICMETLELVYTGDTTFAGLLEEAARFIFTAQILIMELTYLDGEKSRADKTGHVHISDILENATLFEDCQHVVFCHLSERYAPHGKALSMLREKLPSELASRSSVSLRSFGSGEHLTALATVAWEERSAEVGWGWGREVPSTTYFNRGGGGAGGGRGSGRGGRGYHQNQVQNYHPSQQYYDEQPSGGAYSGGGRTAGMSSSIRQGGYGNGNGSGRGYQGQNNYVYRAATTHGPSNQSYHYNQPSTYGGNGQYMTHGQQHNMGSYHPVGALMGVQGSHGRYGERDGGSSREEGRGRGRGRHEGGRSLMITQSSSSSSSSGVATADAAAAAMAVNRISMSGTSKGHGPTSSSSFSTTTVSGLRRVRTELGVDEDDTMILPPKPPPPLFTTETTGGDDGDESGVGKQLNTFAGGGKSSSMKSKSAMIAKDRHRQDDRRHKYEQGDEDGDG